MDMRLYGYEIVTKSNKREWNNCFIKFCTLVYLEIIAKFCRFLILQNDRKLMWQNNS